MIRRLILTALLTAALLFSAAGCSQISDTTEVQAQAGSAAAAVKEGMPAVIEAFHIFSTEMGASEDGRFYVEWTASPGEKTVESVFLSVAGQFADRPQDVAEQNSEEITFWLRVPEGVNPETGSAHLEKSDAFAEDCEYTARITRISFTDGTILEGENLSNSVSASMWGSRGEGDFPARLNEATFWRQSAVEKNVDFQADWTNCAEEKEILGVVYRIEALDSEGSPLKKENGEDAVLYYSSWEDNPVLPGERNQKSGGRLHHFDYEWLSGAHRFTISIERVIDRTGTFWDAPEANRSASCIVTGKKGYAFEDTDSYPAIVDLIRKLNEHFSEQGLSYDNPEVFVRKHEYCVLRYPDLDIRAELTAENEIGADKAAFIWYGTVFALDDLPGKLEALRLAIYPAILTKIDPAEAVEKITAFNNNQRSYIDFTDQSYDTFQDSGGTLDKYGNEVPFAVEAAGRELYYPTDFFLWAKGYPYEENAQGTVRRRPTWDADYSVIKTADGELPKLPVMWFSSGSGAWGTRLNLQPGGSFTGSYENIDWDVEEEKTIRYSCTFSGTFTEIQRRDDYSFKMKLDHIQYEKEPGEEAEGEGETIHYTKPAGIAEEDQEFVLYLPGAEIAGMSDGFLSWVWSDTGILTDDIPDRQPFYSLHNLTQDTGFKGWPE